MNALLHLLLAVALQDPAAAAPASMLLLPVATAKDASTSTVQLAASIERTLSRSLTRYGAYSALREADVRAKLGEAVAAQLQGCDESSCLAGIAEALGTDFILQTRLEEEPGLYVVRLTLLDRKKAEAVLRRELRARSVDALVASVDTLAREISGGGKLVAADPQLAARLGTDEEGARLLRERLAANPGMSPSEAWTDVILERNRESDALAWAEGGLVLAASLLILSTGPVLFPAFMVSALSFNQQGPASLVGKQGRTEGPYTLPFHQPLILGVLTLVGVVSLVPVVIAGILGVVDWLDIGRIRADEDGCCRDETRIRAAARPSAARRFAPVLAGIGAALIFGWPVAFQLFATGFALVTGTIAVNAGMPTLPTPPGIAVDERTFILLWTAQIWLSGTMLLSVFASGLVAATAALLLTWSAYAPVVDARE